MPLAAKEADWLKGKRVAFSGRLASMSRAEASQLVRGNSGAVVPMVNSETNILVLGQDDQPISDTGRVSARLQTAQRLQQQGHAISILAEDEFLQRLGLDAHAQDVRRLYPTSHV